jgi:hypothetical protein
MRERESRLKSVYKKACLETCMDIISKVKKEGVIN